MKKCPYCAEKIKDEAIVCRYCRRDIPAITVVAEDKPQSKVKVNASAWKQGAKASAVLSTIYLLASLNNSTFRIDILIVGFVAWWVICAGVVWIWRKMGAVSFLLVFGSLLLIVVLVFIANGSNSFSSTLTAPTSTPTRTPIPTAIKTQTPTRPRLASNCTWSNEIPEDSLGKEICIQGFVNEISGHGESSGSTRIYFRNLSNIFSIETQTDFYIVDEAYYYPNLSIGDCIYASGILRVNNEGIYFMQISNGLHRCP